MFSPAPVVVKNIIIINVIFFIATNFLPLELDDMLAGHYLGSEFFRPWQIVTHMFMHAGFTHIFFNMYALYLFGSRLEMQWGPNRFLIYYMISGIGAFFLHEGVNHFEIMKMVKELNEHPTENLREYVQAIINSKVVGASGAVFGVLLAFGILYPDTELFLLFPPIPIKARYLVFGYGALELFLAFQNAETDNVAHYAHLGGMLFGYLVLRYWKYKHNSYY
ncbi:MAG: rhomboid family intramembrane serine protease [Crocinitomicaceae bacterium]|nr:rhomboid family intramembrane serine protease [Crocinitomicaceae bacterium]